MKVKIAALLVTLVCSAPGAMAQQNMGFNKVYDATYDYYMPSGPTTMRLSCDGAGRIRSETVLNGRSHVSISDYNQKATFAIDDSTKAVTKMAQQNTPGTPSSSDAQRVSLGDRVFDGHNCEGWQTTTNGKKTELWVDKDLGCTVLMTIDGKPQMKLKSASANSIGAQYFSPPPGYRVVDMNETVRRMQEMAKKYPQRKQR
jgi:hypothetical protein